MSSAPNHIEGRSDEDESLITQDQEKVERPAGLRAIVASVADLYPSTRRNGSSVKLLNATSEEDIEHLEDVDLAQHQDQHQSTRRWRWRWKWRRKPDVRRFIPTLKGFVLAVFFFVLGIAAACGLGLTPYFSSLLHLFAAPKSSAPPSVPSTNAFGVPVDLPIVPITQLINTTELSLSTGFPVSRVPTTRSYVLAISHALAAPDGVYKPMLLANGQSPGPLIEANTGDTVRVTVVNNTPNTTTSIHFHGINQYNSTWADGVAGVSQCGIPAGGGAFTYEFTVADQRGTYWWHAHAGVQFTDGLFGPLVVHDPDEMVPATDGDRILFLGENYHAFAAELAAAYLSPSTPWDPDEAGVEPLADSLLLNGMNTFDCAVVSTTTTTFAQADGAQKTHSCTGGRAYEMTVKPGATIRLRLVNHSSYLSYWFSIDSHALSIVEIDGVEVEPLAAPGGVHVNIGQRYSVLVTADQGAGGGGAYAIRSTLERECFLPFATYVSSGLASGGYEARGVLRYEGAAAGGAETADATKAEADANTNITNPWGCNDMPFSLPQPRRPEPAHELADADPRFVVDFQFRQVGEVNRIFLNRTSWAPYADDATLWQAVEQDFATADVDEGGAYHNWGFRLDQQVLLVPERSGAVQVAINSLDVMEHPFHMQ